MNDPDSPFHNFTVKRLIGRLEELDVKELVIRPLKGQLEIKLVNEDEIVKRIYEFTSGHPSIVQQICQRLIHLLYQRQVRQITLNDVEMVISQPTFQRDGFLNTFWERATILEQVISLIMAQSNVNFFTLHEVRQALGDQFRAKRRPGALEVYQALSRLTELRNILKMERNGYEFDVKSFPRVIANTVTARDLLEVLAEEYSRFGDIVPKFAGKG